MNDGHDWTVHDNGPAGNMHGAKGAEGRTPVPSLFNNPGNMSSQAMEGVDTPANNTCSFRAALNTFTVAKVSFNTGTTGWTMIWRRDGDRGQNQLQL